MNCNEKEVKNGELNVEPAPPGPAGGGQMICQTSPVRAPRFSEELERLIETFAERTVCLQEVMAVVHNRSYTVLLILLSFPFCTPIPLPGVSLPFGLVIAFMGFRLALGKKPWLPSRLLDTRLPAGFFTRLLRVTRRLVCWLEWMLKPRLGWLFGWRLAMQGMGMIILVCGLLLMIPLPIPLSNGLPALTVLLLASAMLEKDGCMAMAGGVAFLLTLAFFAVLFWGGSEAVNWLQDRFEILPQGDED